MTSFILVAWLLIIQALAKPANDWDTPCFDGECAYDMPESTGHSGILRMSGAAITDITPAAGWVILDCDPHSLEQEIRLVCSDDHASAGCNHLFDNGGPVHKVVRLPESCTASPFLRIAGATVAEDQTIPRHALGKVVKRDGFTLTVHVLRVDANWEDADVSKTGVVNFTFTGINAPSVDDEVPHHTLVARGFFDWLQKAWHTVKNYVVNATTALVQKLKELTGFKINPEAIKRARVTLNKTTIFELDAQHKPKCDKDHSISANVKVTADGFLIATLRLGLLANGSIIPPTIGSFAVYTIVDADVDVHIIANASITGHIETPRKKLAHHSVSPLQIPGIISLGPFVDVEISADLDLQLALNLDTTLRYKIDQCTLLSHLEYWYPKKITEDIHDIKSGSKAVATQPTTFSLSASANVAATANITAHLIPSLHLGLSLGPGSASLSAYVEADIWARAHLKGEMTANITRRHALDAPKIYVPPYLSARASQAQDVAFKGCVGFFGGVILRAGAKGHVGKYKAETQPWTIVQIPEVTIYNHCWGGANGQHHHRRSLPMASSLERRVLKIQSLKCGHQIPTSLGTVNLPGKSLHGTTSKKEHEHKFIVSDGSDE